MNKAQIFESLQAYSDSDLQEVLKVRELKRKAELLRKAETYAERLTYELRQQPNAVDILAPEHGRTSCADACVVNGFSDGRFPRCNRCALLQIIRGEVAWPVEFVLYVNVDQAKLE
jgi:hypothetical protein